MSDPASRARPRHGSARPHAESQTREQHDRLPALTEVCGDDAEILGMTVLRFIAAAYATGDARCLEAAHQGVERLLGPVEGARFVGSMTGLMRAIRAERDTDWRFMPTACCRITADEQALVTLLAAARRSAGLSLDVAKAARRVAEGDEAHRITVAAHVAAEALERAGRELAALRHTEPALRVRLH